MAFHNWVWMIVIFAPVSTRNQPVSHSQSHWHTGHFCQCPQHLFLLMGRSASVLWDLSGSGPWTWQCLVSQTFLKWLEWPNGRCTKPIFEAFRAIVLNVSLGTTHPTLCWSPGPLPTVGRGIGCTMRMLGQMLNHCLELLCLLPKSCVHWPWTLRRDCPQDLWFATSLFLSREKRLNFYSSIQLLHEWRNSLCLMDLST